MKQRFAVLLSLLAAATWLLPTPAQAIDPNSVAATFDRLTASSRLANPSVVLIDESTGQLVFEKNASSLRKPASVMKLYSAAAALTYLNPEQQYTTIVSLGTQPRSIVIRGSRDPWISFKGIEAKKMHRTSMPSIALRSMAALKKASHRTVRNPVIYYSDLYERDVANLKIYLRHKGIYATLKKVDQPLAMAYERDLVMTSQSPALTKILAFTLTWSDNVLAERIARQASIAAGNPGNDEGVAQTFTTVLEGLGISSGNLTVKDASGLSKENRVTATQVAQLLIKIRHDPKFAPIISGLPVGGVSGTLRNRFLETAPQAVGLVKAKSGTLNGTVNLAGYVQAADREYAFVIIADKLRKSSTAEKLARKTVDKILGQLAAPFFPPLLPVQTDATVVTVSS
jgi:D-alanyl-D-alanine carboxypeptidase